MTRREIAMKIAWSYLGTPYIWGGDDPEGFDCSGFVVEVLKSVGVLPRKGDWTAETLFHHLNELKCIIWTYEVARVEGSLVFFYNKTQTAFVHVEIYVGKGLSLGASGGGSHVTNRKAAMDYNAFIKVRPCESDKRTKIIVDPFTAS